jgi:hypothetical protein
MNGEGTNNGTSRTPDEVGRAIFSLLYEMAVESAENGQPYGLRGWAEHYRKTTKIKLDPIRDWESAITRSIAQGLWEARFPAFAEVEYLPTTPGIADRNSGAIWLCISAPLNSSGLNARRHTSTISDAPAWDPMSLTIRGKTQCAVTA